MKQKEKIQAESSMNSTSFKEDWFSENGEKKWFSLPDGNVPPDGKQHRQPNWDGVKDDGDVRVSQRVHRPAVGEHLRYWNWLAKEVVNHKGQIGGDDHQVAHCHRHQYRVCRRDHVLSVSVREREENNVLTLVMKSN